MLKNGTRLSAKHILIAAGGRPVWPGIAGQELGMISDDLFLMETLPQRALIVGGGFIACEFATILNGLGVDVIQTYRGDAVLRGFDLEAREMATRQLQDIGIDLRLGLTPSACRREQRRPD